MPYQPFLFIFLLDFCYGVVVKLISHFQPSYEPKLKFEESDVRDSVIWGGGGWEGFTRQRESVVLGQQPLSIGWWPSRADSFGAEWEAAFKRLPLDERERKRHWELGACKIWSK
jgi:hypothetical protein